MSMRGSRQAGVLALLMAVFLLLLAAGAPAQVIEATITVDAERPGVVNVEGRFTRSAKRSDKKTFFVTDEHAGAAGLENRFSGLELLANGENTKFRRIGAGAFLAEKEFDAWRYSVDLSPAGRRAGTAHISRLDGTSGVLMPEDLLPLVGDVRSAAVVIRVPAGWEMYSTENRRQSGMFLISDVKNSVVAIGKDWRFIQGSGISPSLAIRGKWHFADADVASFALQILGYYETVFGSQAAGRRLIVIAPPPTSAGAGSWEADTRGKTVNILMADTAFATQSKQRLHEILRHELFHLWLPNDVWLKGYYAWFYEGAAVYASLRAGVFLGRIRFDDMLDTLARTYQIEASSERLSLTAMQQQGNAGAASRLYARGMLTAFLCDIEMLAASGGKRSFETLLLDVYVAHKPPAEPVPATEAVLQRYAKYPELSPIVTAFITGDRPFEWGVSLNKAGLEFADGNLRVAKRHNGKQKALLDKLGYNAWRRFIP